MAAAKQIAVGFTLQKRLPETNAETNIDAAAWRAQDFIVVASLGSASYSSHTMNKM